MKLYMFDTDTGLYLGEDFGAETDVNISEGLTALAPPDYDHGQTPVYDFEHQRWVLIDSDKVPSVLFQKKTAEINES